MRARLEAGGSAMKFRDAVKAAGFGVWGSHAVRLANELGYNVRQVRRWRDGDADVPAVVWLALEALTRRHVDAKSAGILKDNKSVRSSGRKVRSSRICA